MRVEDSGKQIGIVDEDIDLVKKARRTNSIILLLAGTLTCMAAFFAGYAVGDSRAGYPYGSIVAVSAVRSQRVRARWVYLLVLAILAFLSFGLGGYAATPSYGVTTLYGVHGTKASSPTH